MPDFSSTSQCKYSFLKFFFFLNFLLFGLALNSSTQETQQTLYRFTPLLINPANTGSFDGIWRASANFRSQQITTGNSFRTASAALDGKLPVLKESLSAGIVLLNDESGVGGLTYNKAYASVAYQHKLGNNIFIGGVQAGMVSLSVNSWNTWDYPSGTFSAPSGETRFNNKTNYLDLNAGVLWKTAISIFEPTVGLSFSHLNSPQISLFEADDIASLETKLHIQSAVILSDKITLEPSILLSSYNGVTPTVLGVNAYYNLQGNSSVVDRFYGGAHIRKGLADKLNTFSFILGSSVRTLDIILGYDMSIGEFNSAGGSKGAFEISIIYRSIPVLLNSYSIPCERY